MDLIRYEKLMQVNWDIFTCRECKFHSELVKKGLPFMPDGPYYVSKDHDYKVITIGINPGWDDKDYKKTWKAIYKRYDQYSLHSIPSGRSVSHLEEYRNAVMDIWKTQPKGMYINTINRVLNIIDAELNVINQELKRTNFFDHVIWANMSFCNSKHPHDKCRIFDDEEIYLNIEEERNACLEKGYLRKIINIINPRLIIFFHWNAYIYKDLIFEIKDEPFERKFKAHVKKGLQVNTIFRALTIDDTKILFLPHPRFLATIKNLPNKLVSFIRELKWNVEGGEN